MNGKSFRRRDEGKKFLLTATEAYEEDGTVSNDPSVCLPFFMHSCIYVCVYLLASTTLSLLGLALSSDRSQRTWLQNVTRRLMLGRIYFVSENGSLTFSRETWS